MTAKEHREKHKELHEALDELAADFMSETRRLASGTTVMELMEWSCDQTKNAKAVPEKGFEKGQNITIIGGE